MWNAIEPAIDSLFVGPVWPASVLVLLVVGYLFLSLLGAVDLDGPSWTIDGDGWESLGAGTLKWFHLGQIPIILWLGCFAVFQWSIAYGLWHYSEFERYQPTWFEFTFLAGRNAIIAALATKLATGPLVPYLAPSPTHNEETLIGEQCTVCSGEANPDFGQAKYHTGGAPLLLNIRTDGPTLPKGSVATIVSYDTQRRLYTVTPEDSISNRNLSETQT
jgi:hypothetical protein